MRIGIAIPFHLRGEKTNECYRRAFAHYASLPYLVHLCGSEGELSREFCEQFLSETVKYVEVPQGEVCNSSAGSEALREKFNDSLKTLPEGLEWYCLAGADDIASPSFFENLVTINANKAVMAGVGMSNPLYLLDEAKEWNAHSIELKYKVKLKLLAGINAFSWAGMAMVQNRPYQLKGCETGAELLFQKHGYVYGIEGWVVMFKGRNVLNGLEKILKAHKQVRITPKELQMLRNIITKTDRNEK